MVGLFTKFDTAKLSSRFPARRRFDTLLRSYIIYGMTSGDWSLTRIRQGRGARTIWLKLENQGGGNGIGESAVEPF